MVVTNEIDRIFSHLVEKNLIFDYMFYEYDTEQLTFEIEYKINDKKYKHKIDNMPIDLILDKENLKNAIILHLVNSYLEQLKNL